MDVNRHLDTATLYELLDGGLDPTDERTAETHLLRCDRCRDAREECGALIGSLEWYGAETPSPPPGYWEDFWDRWPLAGRVEPRTLVPNRAGASAALLAAALAALVVTTVWTTRPDREVAGPAPVVMTAPAGVDDAVDPEWERDYELFERATVSVGGVGPLTRGVALVSLATEP